MAAVRAGNYNTWPMLTVKAIQKYYPETDETPKGHMKTQRQRLRSTKVKIKQEETQEKKTKEYVSCVPKEKNAGNVCKGGGFRGNNVFRSNWEIPVFVK